MRKIIFFIILPLLILSFFWQLNKNLALRKLLKEKNNALETSEAASRHLEKLKKQELELQEKEKILRRKLPADDRQPLALIKALISLGRETGLREISLSIKEEPAAEAKGSYSKGNEMASASELEEIPQSAAKSSASSNDMEVSVSRSGSAKSRSARNGEPEPVYLEINCEGTFQQLIIFLNRLRELERIVAVGEISIERKKDILPFQKISLELVTYTL